MREFIEAPGRIYEEARVDGRLIDGKSFNKLKKIALDQEGVVETQFGSLAVDSEPMSRAAPKTKNNLDYEFGDEERQLALQAVDVLRECRVVCLDAPVGENSGVTVRFLLPEKYAHIAYGLKLLFGPWRRKVDNPTYSIVFFTDDAFEANKKIRDVREKDVTIRLWMGSKRGEQVKICRNSTYLGEGKKGTFQFEDWRVKEIDKEGLFLHAGVRRDRLWVYNHKTRRPELTWRTTAISGLTATGKTTTLCRRFARIPREKSEMIGEDGGSFRFDGSYCAFEPMGLYVKTDGIDDKQPEILRATTSSEAYLENISLSRYPYIPNFSDTRKTTNGRAIVLRKNLEIASKGLCTDKVHNIILLTRNPLMNVISKLTHEQATMQFIYGESIESSGGIAVDAGKFKREFFLDPFIVGDRLKHALIYYDLLKRNPSINCYLANTGTIGEDERKVTLRDSLAVYNDLLRNSLRFSEKPDALGYHYPTKSDRANLEKLMALDKFKPETLEKRIEDFLIGRRRYLNEFESKWGTIPSIIKESLRYE